MSDFKVFCAVVGISFILFLSITLAGLIPTIIGVTVLGLITGIVCCIQYAHKHP